MIRGVHISMGKFQRGFLKKHIIFPGCICFPDYKNIRVEFFDPGKLEFWAFEKNGPTSSKIKIVAVSFLGTVNIPSQFSWNLTQLRQAITPL